MVASELKSHVGSFRSRDYNEIVAWNISALLETISECVKHFSAKVAASTVTGFTESRGHGLVLPAWSTVDI